MRPLPWHHPNGTISSSQQSALLPYLMKHPHILPHLRDHSRCLICPWQQCSYGHFYKLNPVALSLVWSPGAPLNSAPHRAGFLTKRSISFHLNAYKAATNTLSKTKMLCCFPHLSRSTPKTAVFNSPPAVTPACLLGTPPAATSSFSRKIPLASIQLCFSPVDPLMHTTSCHPIQISICMCTV